MRFLRPSLLVIPLCLIAACSKGDPKLKVEPGSLDYGFNDTTRLLTITNVGDDGGIFTSGVKDLNFSLTSDSGWVSVAPTSGVCAKDQTVTVTATINRSIMRDGANQAAIDVSSNGGEDVVVVSANNADTSPPVVTWITPAAGVDTLFVFETDTTTIELQAVDTAGIVTKVDVFVGGTLDTSLTVAPYRALIDLSGVANNRSTRIYAVATDTAGNTGSTADTLRFVRSLPPATATWRLLTPSRKPVAREDHTLSLDVARSRAVCFGGFSVVTTKRLNDLWSFDFATDNWDSLSFVDDTLSPALPPRRDHAASVLSDSLLVMGGEAGPSDSLRQDFGIFDFATGTWRIAFLPDLPTSALPAAAVGNRVYAYGGKLGTSGFPNASDRLWIYDGGTASWSFSTGHLPGLRRSPALAADLEGDRLFVYGGVSQGSGGGPTDSSNYRFTLGSGPWISTLAPGPPPLDETAVAYDSLNNRIVLWGGTDGQGGMPTEVWEFSLGAQRWRRIPTTGTQPTGRAGHQMVMDAARTRVIIFGGRASGASTDETWELKW